MRDFDGDDMLLTPDAERVCSDLVSFGAVATSGHRSVAGQARAMAVNVSEKRDFIGLTYRHGRPLQLLVDAHPEWQTAERIGEELYREMTLHPELARGLSHHCQHPCPCFDLDPDSITERVRLRIEDYQREGVITQVLWREGGLKKCHVEVAALEDVKVRQV